VVAGTLLYCRQAVDNTILPALSTVAIKQANPMMKTIEKMKQLLDYCTTQEEVVKKCKASKMILTVHSNGGYGNEKKSRNQAGWHFFMSNNKKLPLINGAILTIATIIEGVVTLAAKVELGAIY
jgi:hypothetical protein